MTLIRRGTGYRRWILLLLLAGSPAFAADDLSVWPATASSSSRKTLREALQRECFAAIDRRLQAYEQIKTSEDLRRWQDERRRIFLQQLGEFPERSPLNARVVGTLKGDG